MGANMSAKSGLRRASSARLLRDLIKRSAELVLRACRPARSEWGSGRALRLSLAAAVFALAAVDAAMAFSLRPTPPRNRLTMNLLLGETPKTFIDPGPNTWNEAAIQALQGWDGVGIGNPRDLIFFSWRGGPGEVSPATTSADPCSFDGVSAVVFMASYCGLPFGGAIAITISRSIVEATATRTVETDVIFDSSRDWNVYSGPILASESGGALLDLRRVALHEFGHAAGLSHPDDVGQTVSAIMNSHITANDTTQADDIAGAHAVVWSAAPTQALFSSLLPTSRSVTVGTPATVFATIINGGTDVAVDCGIALGSAIPASLAYQTTDPASNQAVGTPNTPASLAPGQSQSFVLAVNPNAAFAATDVSFDFDCANNTPATVLSGVNTLLLSGNDAPVPDVIALVGTTSNDGIVNVPGSNGTGAFAVASANVGASGDIAVSADTGATPLPLNLSVCRTNPADGRCLQPAAAFASMTIGGGDTPTFAVFLEGGGTAVPFDPARNRVFVRFRDASGAVRGATSVAVRTL